MHLRQDKQISNLLFIEWPFKVFFLLFDCERLVEVVFLKALYWTVIHAEISRCTNSISLFNSTVIVWLRGWSEVLVLVGKVKIVEKELTKLLVVERIVVLVLVVLVVD